MGRRASADRSPPRIPDRSRWREAAVRALPLSEDHFRPKLNLARRADDAGNGSGSARADGGVRQIELRRVEDVEALGAKLEPRVLLDAELLEQREVEVHAPRSVQDIPARIAVGEWRRRRKR